MRRCIFRVEQSCRHPVVKGAADDARCAACPQYAGPPRGAGDIVHAVAAATGIARAVGDCGGCKRRRAALNRLLPMPDTHSED